MKAPWSRKPPEPPSLGERLNNHRRELVLLGAGLVAFLGAGGAWHRKRRGSDEPLNAEPADAPVSDPDPTPAEEAPEPPPGIAS